MNRDQLQQIAKLRLAEAKLLLDAYHNSGAYYLVGYAVECGLKACIAKQTKRYDFPEKKFINDVYSHDLNRLVIAAGLQLKLSEEIKRDPAFEVNWAVVKDWKAESRYQEWTELEAKNLYDAVANRRHGIFRWLKQHW